MKTTIRIFEMIFALLCIFLLPNTHAVSPPPDGGYPGGNTAEGQTALFSLTTGGFNTGIGFLSLRSNTIGSFNTATGAGTLLANTADGNTAAGAGALLSNNMGIQNTANGAFALFSNTVGGNNTANGYQALQNNTVSGGNTANGAFALLSNTGGANTAIGASALGNNATGNNNTALGFLAGQNVTTANNVICISADGNNVDNSCYIGNIFGATSSGGIGVFVNSNGRLGTMTSSRRFKEEIKPMEHASKALFALQPVTFRYKKEIDSQSIPQFGLVAEDVEKVNGDLVVRDKEGKPYSVRYDQVNAMLLNEFLKEHRRVEEQQAQISELNSKAARQEAVIAQQQQEFQATTSRQEDGIRALTASLKEQAAQIQRVSAQIEMNMPATKVAGAGQ